MTGLIDMVVLSLLVVVAIAIAQLRNLFAAVMLTGLFSLLSAAWMVVLDAPDVAYTEAAVGAGIATVLMLATLSLTTEEEDEPALVEPGPLFVALVTGVVLLYAMLDVPSFGAAGSPVHTHVGAMVLERAPHEIGVPNLVTAVLASYRGYDTLGETTVVLTAAVGVLAMLTGRTGPTGDVLPHLSPDGQTMEVVDPTEAVPFDDGVEDAP